MARKWFARAAEAPRAWLCVRKKGKERNDGDVENQVSVQSERNKETRKRERKGWNPATHKRGNKAINPKHTNANSIQINSRDRKIFITSVYS